MLSFGLLTAGLIVELSLQPFSFFWQLATTFGRMGSWVAHVDLQARMNGWDFSWPSVPHRPSWKHWPIGLELALQLVLVSCSWVLGFCDVSSVLIVLDFRLMAAVFALVLGGAGEVDVLTFWVAVCSTGPRPVLATGREFIRGGIHEGAILDGPPRWGRNFDRGVKMCLVCSYLHT